MTRVCAGCVKALRAGGQEARVCDGVVDCPDFSDELYCDYCPERHFHCGVGKQCIDKARMCDGRQDCDNGADERGCGEWHRCYLERVPRTRVLARGTAASLYLCPHPLALCR